MRFRLQAVVDTAVDGIIMMDAAGKVTMFNRACERIFGYSADEIVGGDVKQLMPPPYADQHDSYLENYERTGEKKIIGKGREVVGRKKSGECFPMDLSVGEVEGGGEVAYVGILRDVSERKRAEQQRERLIEQLAAQNSEQTHFVHAASHDLREPLRMISVFCGRLGRDYLDRLDPRGQEYLSLTIAAAARMNELLDDLVAYARLDVDAERGSRFDVNAHLDEVIDGLAEPIRNSGAEITHGVLPEIVGSPMRFQRLMQNLIGNALKYVGQGVRPRIHVDAVREGEFWRFSVSDNGIGIDPRHFERIFEPFKRLHGRGQYNGTGLGLAICRKIVEGFGGVLSVRSSEGQGSTFSFTILAEGEANEQGRTDFR